MAGRTYNARALFKLRQGSIYQDEATTRSTERHSALPLTSIVK